MPLLFLTALLSLFSPRANSMTQALFSSDGTQATILLAGMPGDSDPAGLYHALRAEPEEFQGKWSKKLSFSGTDGGKAIDIACIFSKVIQNSGTCTLILRQSPGLVEISRGEGCARLWLRAELARSLAAAFVLHEETTSIFRSRDGKLNISTARERGAITDLVVDWNGPGLL